jgi:thiol:disulfide interchange protein DsbC
MLKNSVPTAATDCVNPILDTMALGQSLGVQGTPTLFLKNGTRAPGALPTPQLNDWLNGKGMPAAVAR